VKNGTEPDRARLSCTECADDRGLRQIFAHFQMKSEFLSVESEQLPIHFQSPPVFYCVLLHSTEVLRSLLFGKYALFYSRHLRLSDLI
jgi:hypothetical protein